VDLHVLPKVDDEKSSAKMAELLRSAGYSAVGLTIPTGLMRERLASLRMLFEHEGLETFLRVDLSASSRMDLLRLLRRYRNAYDLVAVKCMNQAVAPVACRDRRVDLVFFDPRNNKVKFGHQLASLLRGSLELNLISTLLGEAKSEIFSRIAKEVSIAREHRSNIVLSSGCSSPTMVRSHLQVSAIAAAIGLSKKQCSEGISETPFSIVERNKERRSREYVEEGVKLVVPKRK
jgi:RNase P/RNase MRP subunit p30